MKPVIHESGHKGGGYRPKGPSEARIRKLLEKKKDEKNWR